MKDGNYTGKGKSFMRRDGLWYPSYGGAPLVLSDEDMVLLYKVERCAAERTAESCTCEKCE